MPPRRIAGSENSAPTTAARTAPISTPSRIGTPWSTARSATVNPPIPANVAWASEICPANPVMIVIDRNVTASVSPSVMRNTHRPLTIVSITRRKPPMKIGKMIFVSRSSSGVL